MKLRMDTTLSAPNSPHDKPVKFLKDMDCIYTHNMKYCTEQKGLYSTKAFTPFFIVYYPL